MHLLSEGLQFLHINAFNQSKEEILERVKNQSAAKRPGEWIRGSGWNQMDWPEKAWPGKEELDAVSPDNPVMLERIDLHSLWVNTKALEAAGITANTPDPQGGEIIKNQIREPLGILVDTARKPVFDAAPPITDEMKMQAYLLAQEECFSYGITSVFDAGASYEEVCLIKKAYETGGLKLRVYEVLTASDGSDTKYIEAGYKPVTGLYGDKLSVNAVKVFADGSIGSRSAYFFDDYNDRPMHKGNAVYTDDELYNIVSRAAGYGFQVSTHAIGDAAIHQVINIYERVLAEQSLTDSRFRIEHFCVPAAADILRAVNSGLVITIQPNGAVEHVDMLTARLGSERLKTAYAWRDIIKAGGYIVGGSDANTDYLNPFYGIYAGIAAKEKPYAMTREESLKSYTIWAAMGQFEENLKGSLEAGKLADFAVLDRDILTCSVRDIRETRVLMTVLGGEVVYEKRDAP
jgi:hypothetical protein